MGNYIKTVVLLLYFLRNSKSENTEEESNKVAESDAEKTSLREPVLSTFVYWPNATVPFYVTPDHFDKEQTTSILTTLALFAFKTCLKFVPVLAPPGGDQHVLVFTNPEGVRKCVLESEGHPIDEPHTLILGYDCLHSPQIDMMLMKALGFPFEHNRASRDLFVDVQFENIDQSAMELFTKDEKLPLELRALPYDPDSVMHFGDRDFSKNGHRTIIFKEISQFPVKQSRKGLSTLDLRKIELVYGPECLRRDRQEKLEICQNFPGVSRRKREVEPELVNLRVNREITPAPHDLATNVNDTVKDLGIENEVQDVVDLVYKVSSKALQNARAKYCNVSKTELRVSEDKVPRASNSSDLLGIVIAITDYAKGMVDSALTNLTEFCSASENMELYQRVGPRCPFYGSYNCPRSYKSTKSGPVRHSTQHRPLIFQSTKNSGSMFHYKHFALRGNNGTDNATVGNGTNDTGSRRKREVPTTSGRRLDDVTRVQRSQDDSTTSNPSGRRDDVTVVIPRSNDKMTDQTEPPNDTNNVTNNDTVSKTNENSSPSKDGSKAQLRSATDLPVKKSYTAFEAVWPFPERHHRRINKLRRKKRLLNRLKNKRPRKYEREDYDREVTEKEVVAASDTEVIEKEAPQKEVLVVSEKEVLEREEYKENSLSIETGPPPTTRNVKALSKKVKLLKRKRTRSPATTFRPASKASFEDDEVAFRDVMTLAEGEQTMPVTVKLSKENKEFYGERKWPDGVVPYVLKEDSNYDLDDVRRRLAEVNSILKRKTCARLQEVAEDEAAQLQDYLVVDTSADYVTGRVGGKQNFGSLELFKGGQHRQHAAMVVMAMLGFYFEVARHDRDKYVRVHLRHVRPDKLHHFEKIRADATLPLAYDYQSATHPAWQFWRQLGRKGISTVATYKSKDPHGTIMKNLGQNMNLLSDIDLVKINSVYGTQCFRARPGKIRTEKKTRQRKHKS